MEFKKYNSIENHYRQKFIDKMVFHNPLAEKCDWIAREKLDGANIQLVFSPNSQMLVGKRTSFLNPDEPFFDIWNTLSRYHHELDVFQRAANLFNVTYRMYGEIYGPGINGRVNYGEVKRIAIFDIEQDGRLLTQLELENFLYTRDMLYLLPKQLAKGTLLEVLEVDVERPNFEGVVIKPYDVNFFLQDERFIIKKKSSLFVDKENGGNDGELPVRENVNDVTYNLNKEFRKYINENRVLDVFAKHGTIQEPKQISDYILYILEDAKVDFLKDHTLPADFTSKQERDVFNVGGIIVGFLKKYM